MVAITVVLYVVAYKVDEQLPHTRVSRFGSYRRAK